MLGQVETNQGACSMTQDKLYFQSYDDIAVHELMLKDEPRTLAYKNFLEKNSYFIRGKVVLDVGAGSGILSLLAARAGAERVYAVEASNISVLCEEIVKLNGLEKVITVIKDTVEKVKLPEKVDIIISEWMGFYLLHESMLDSVLYARDKWLKDDGFLLPSHATLYCAPVSMSQYYKDNFECWKNMYGFDFTPFLTVSVQKSFTQPAVTELKSEQCLSKAEIVVDLDLKTATLWDIQDVVKKLEFHIHNEATLHGFATWFEVRFTPHVSVKIFEKNTALEDIDSNTHGITSHGVTVNGAEKEDWNSNSDLKDIVKKMEEVTLSTSPTSPPTHWKQTVCFIPASVSLSKGEIIYCKLSLSQDDGNKRHYNMSLEMLDCLDSDESDTDNFDDDDDEDEDASEHPVPCDCDMARCRLIKALTEKYDAEQNELEMEAEFVDVTAEVQAAQTLDDDSSYLDSEALSGSVNNDDSYSKE